jgi:DNA-binding response OmpR family regulator
MAQPKPAILETILVVKGNPIVLKFLTVCLANAGFSVLSTASPEEARPVEIEHPGPIRLLIPDAIILHTSGPDLEDELIAKRAEMGVILISSCPDDVRLFEYKGTFLKKPFVPNELLDMVNDPLCRNAHARTDGPRTIGAHQ